MSHTADDRPLADRIVALDTVELHSLLRLLYSERGYHVDDGVSAPDGWRTLRVTSSREGSHTVFCPVEPSPPTTPSVEPGDRLVRLDGDDGDDDPAVLTADGLAERVRYALSPAAQRHVAETVFDTDRERLLDTPAREREPPSPPDRVGSSGRDDESAHDGVRDGRTHGGARAHDGTHDESRAGVSDAETPGRGESFSGATATPRGESSDGVAAAGADEHAATVGDDAVRETESVGETAVGPDGPDDTTDDGATVGGATRRSRFAFGGVALVGVLVVAAALGVAPLPPGLDGGTDGPPARGFQPGGPPTETLTAGGGGTPVTTPTPVSDATRLPPGVAADGAIDETAVADATVAALENRSYRLVVTYRERVDGEPTARLREVARVGGATRYASRVSVLGDPVGSPSAVDQTAVYAADGRVIEQSTVSGVVERGTPTARDPFLDRIEQYTGWYLGVERSRVVDRVRENGERLTFLRLRGDPWPGVENTTGTAVVTGEGVLRAVHRSYTLPDRPSVRATVTVRIEAVGETAVRRPAWAASSPLNGTATNRSDTAVGAATTDGINGTTVVVG